MVYASLEKKDIRCSTNTNNNFENCYFAFFVFGPGVFKRKISLIDILIDKTFTTSVVRTARHLGPSSWHCSSLFPLPLIRNVFNTLINMIFKIIQPKFYDFCFKNDFFIIRFINAALIKEEKLVSVFFIAWHLISDGFSSYVTVHIICYFYCLHYALYINCYKYTFRVSLYFTFYWNWPTWHVKIG